MAGPPALRVGGWVLVGLFTVSGVVHLVRPGAFTPIVPDVLPAHRLLVHVSGVAELLCAAGLVWRRTRRLAGWAAAALLLAVFPANVTMAVDGWRSWRDGVESGPYVAATLLRLPLQVPMIWWAWRVTSGHLRKFVGVSAAQARTSLRWHRSEDAQSAFATPPCAARTWPTDTLDELPSMTTSLRELPRPG